MKKGRDGGYGVCEGWGDIEVKKNTEDKVTIRACKLGNMAHSYRKHN